MNRDMKTIVISGVLLCTLAALLLGASMPAAGAGLPTSTATAGAATPAHTATTSAGPRLRIAPAAAMPGDSVLVEGTGWPAKTRVWFSLGAVNTGAGGNYGTAIAGARGGFQSFVTLRTLPNGRPIPMPSTVVLLAHSAEYRLTATARVTVAQPSLTSDRARGPAGTTVTLRGQGWPAGTHVIISLGGATTGAGGVYGCAVANAQGRLTVRATLATLPNGAPLRPGPVVLLAHNADGSLKAALPFTISR